MVTQVNVHTWKPNRRIPRKVLVDKTLRFVDDVWSTYVQRNMQVTGYVHTTILYCSKHEVIHNVSAGLQKHLVKGMKMRR